MFLAPIAAIIPAAATSSALIYVGLLMLGGLKKIDFDDMYQSLPVAIMLISMPISGSIGHGIGLGLISYSVLKLCTGKGQGRLRADVCHLGDLPCEVLPRRLRENICPHGRARLIDAPGFCVSPRCLTKM